MKNSNLYSLATATGLVVLLLVLGTAGCSVFSSSAKDFTAESSVEAGHSHSVTVQGSDIDEPPDQRVITTTEAGTVAHTHTITLTKADFQALEDGQEVRVTSSEANFHTHIFDIKK